MIIDYLLDIREFIWYPRAKGEILRKVKLEKRTPFPRLGFTPNCRMCICNPWMAEKFTGLSRLKLVYSYWESRKLLSSDR